MNDAAQWWYERNGQQMGPVPLEKLQELAAARELAPTALVWTAGMPTWARADSVPSLAWPAEPPPMPAAPPPRPEAGAPPPPPAAAPPPAAGPPPRAAPLARGAAAAAVAEPEQIAIGVTILLSIVTLGIWGAIKFFQTGKAYERLAGRETRFALYFWLFIALSYGGVFVGALTGIPFGIAAVVFMFLALAEALRARREGLQRWALAPAVASDNTHYLYLGLGVLLAPVLVGLVFLVLQAVKWFEDWNASRAAATQRG
jgi:hypothetical protein